jgi:hypothetical protein
MSGTIPTTFGNLGQVTTMHLHSINFIGTIPSTFGSLSLLKVLLLDNTQLRGNVPFTLCSTIAVLRIDCNEIACTCCTDALGNDCS